MEQYQLASLIDFQEIQRHLKMGWEPFAVTYEAGKRYYHLRDKMRLVDGEWERVNG